MSSKYVVELTKAQLSIVKQAMTSHFYDIDDVGYNSSEKACFHNAYEILIHNKKTKAQYLRENRK